MTKMNLIRLAFIVFLLIMFNALIKYEIFAQTDSNKKTDGRKIELLKAITGLQKEEIDTLNSLSNAKVKSELTVNKCNVEIADSLIKAGIDINAKYEGLGTALMVAVSVGCAEIVKSLLEAGANVNEIDNDSTSALMLAAKSGNTQIVEHLINYKADVNQQDKNGRTALMIAAEIGNIEIVKYLVNVGADINKDKGDGWNALLYAIHNDQLEIVKYLLASGATISSDNWLIFTFSTPYWISHKNFNEIKSIVKKAYENQKIKSSSK